MFDSFDKIINRLILEKGGWVNAHAHADRAFTMTPEKLKIYQTADLQKKWDLVDEIKKSSSTEIYYDRLRKVADLMIEQGVKVFTTFIDIDPVAGDRAIKAALRVKEEYKNDLKMYLVNQTIKGVINDEARKWFDFGSDLVDIIGGLPYRDEVDHGKGIESFNIIFETAKKYNKMLHVHVDQFNSVNEIETQILAEKTIEYGMQGKVVGIHGISIGSHNEEYRHKLYNLMREAKLMMIACPLAWIDSPRKEELQPVHNSLTPLDEMQEYDIPVAIGTDNICDYMVPLSNGSMWSELQLLCSGTRFTKLEEIVKIASINGRKTVGLLGYEY